MEICGKVLGASADELQVQLRACSNCAGDYEDPDCAANAADDRDIHLDEAPADEFPIAKE